MLKTGFTLLLVSQFIYLPPRDPNAYAPGTDSDAAGRPFVWVPDDGSERDPFSEVHPDAFGPQIGEDQYGRVVRPHAVDGDDE